MLNPRYAHFRGDADAAGGPCWCPIPSSTVAAFGEWNQLQEVRYTGQAVLVCSGAMAVLPAPPVPHRIEIEVRQEPCKPSAALLIWRSTLEDLYLDPDMNRKARGYRDPDFETCIRVRPVERTPAQVAGGGWFGR